jgi:hypothetical protein
MAFKNARTSVNVAIPQDASALHQEIVKLLTLDGYYQFTYPKTGELVWKKGDGILTAMRFVKLDYQPGVLILSCWIAGGIGNLIGREQPLEGVVGAVPKMSLRKTFENIQKLAAAACGNPAQ